jgi:hypothetical protein
MQVQGGIRWQKLQLKHFLDDDSILWRLLARIEAEKPLSEA